MNNNHIFSELNFDDIIEKNIIPNIKPNNISILDDIPTSSIFHISENALTKPVKDPIEILTSKKNNTLTPNVIDKKIINKLNKAVKIQNAILEKESKKTFWNSLTTFYENWIAPNIFLIMFVVFLSIVLYYRCDSLTGYKHTPMQGNLKQKISQITLNTLKVKKCGHRLNQQCLCYKLSTKENILKSIDAMSQYSQPLGNNSQVISMPINNQSYIPPYISPNHSYIPSYISPNQSYDQQTIQPIRQPIKQPDDLINDPNLYSNAYQIDSPFTS